MTPRPSPQCGYLQHHYALSATAWPQLANQARHLVERDLFAKAGLWRLTYVRLDVPRALTGHSQGHTALAQWFASLCPYLIAASERSDTALQLRFERV